jgi:hypothetical protein
MRTTARVDWLDEANQLISWGKRVVPMLEVLAS